MHNCKRRHISASVYSVGLLYKTMNSLWFLCAILLISLFCCLAEYLLTEKL